jgi:hypothetical protein
MRVEIKTEYLGQNRYRITVKQDGVTNDTIRATRLTVADRRNRACQMWAKVADLVEASAIPEAWDMAVKGAKR